ncbi:type VI secretion system PAAR protein [Sessilibacter corallicola]
MGNAVKLGDIGTGHGGFPPTPVISGSSDVFVNGLPAGRVGDSLLPHLKPKHPPHPRSISSGSSSVFINGKAAAFTGGSVSCGGTTVGGGNVTIGDKCVVKNSSFADIEETVNFNRKFIFKDNEGNIIPGVRYKLELSNGEIVEGTSDENGESDFATSEGSAVAVKVLIQA